MQCFTIGIKYNAVLYPDLYECVHNLNITVDVERFAGLNFCGFNPTEVSAEILSRSLSQKSVLLKSGDYIHGKTYMVLLKTGSLAL